MTPKEKAKDLVNKMYFSRKYKEGEDYIPEQALIHAKECALIAVDEIINAIDFDWMEVQNLDRQHAYWQEVKNEIEKL